MLLCAPGSTAFNAGCARLRLTSGAVHRPVTTGTMSQTILRRPPGSTGTLEFRTPLKMKLASSDTFTPTLRSVSPWFASCTSNLKASPATASWGNVHEAITEGGATLQGGRSNWDVAVSSWEAAPPASVAAGSAPSAPRGSARHLTFTVPGVSNAPASRERSWNTPVRRSPFAIRAGSPCICISPRPTPSHSALVDTSRTSTGASDADKSVNVAMQLSLLGSQMLSLRPVWS